MLWEVEIAPRSEGHDLEITRIRSEYALLSGPIPSGDGPVSSYTRGYLLEGELSESDARQLVDELLIDPLVEAAACHPVLRSGSRRAMEWTVLLKPGVM